MYKLKLQEEKNNNYELIIQHKITDIEEKTRQYDELDKLKPEIYNLKSGI
jgi:hypothetical protein